ncbi:MAG: DUF4836 family protein [Clostridium sp.]|nr:DUF4836 family protein [Clostridium sp.]
MNKKLSVALAGTVVALAMAIGVYHLCSSEPAYKQVLPADATVLVCVDGTEVAKAVNMAEIASLAGLTDEKDIKDCGLDLSEKIYGFYRNPKSMGLVAAVSDADKLTAYLAKNADLRRSVSTLEEKDGCNWLEVQDGEVLVAYNQEVLLAVGPVKPFTKEEVRQQMLQWLSQEKEESALEGKLYEKLNRQKGLLTYALSLEAIPEYKLNQLVKQVSLPDVEMLKSVGVAGGLQVDRTKVSCPLEVFSDNDAFNSQWDNADKSLRKLTSDFVKHIPAGVIGWIGWSIDGKKVLEEMRKNPDVRTGLVALNLMADVDKIIQSLDGEMMMAMKDEDAILLTARVNDNTVLKNLPEWVRPYEQSGSWSCTPTAENEYMLGAPAGQFAVGVRGDRLYLSTESLLAEQVGKDIDADEWKAYAPQMKENMFFLVFSLPNFMQSDSYRKMTRYDRSLAFGYGLASRMVRDVVFSVQDVRHCTLEVIWVKDSEILKTYLK